MLLAAAQGGAAAFVRVPWKAEEKLFSVVNETAEGPESPEGNETEKRRSLFAFCNRAQQDRALLPLSGVARGGIT